MDEKEILELAEQEKTYWWHIVRREILQSVLNRFFDRHSGLACPACPENFGATAGDPESRQENKQKNSFCFGLDSRPCLPVGKVRGNDKKNRDYIKILDVGCGTGENFYWLSQFGGVVGVDTNELAIKLASQKGIAVLGRAEDLPFEDNTFDLVTAFDVLEHTENDSQTLKEWGRVLSDRGLLFLSVPAHQWLFGSHDRALGHLRRYSLFQSRKILRDNNFKIIFSSYFFFFSFPVFISQRWLAKFSKRDTSQYVRAARWLNNFLIGLGKLEAAWLKISVLPFGSSIVVLAQKKDNNPLSSSGDRMFPSVRHAEFMCPACPENFGANAGISASPRKILKLVQDDGEDGQDGAKTMNRFKIVKQFLKFAVVGLGNTAIDIGLLNLLIFWNWPVLWANTVAFIFAATNGFFLNKYWTFGDKEGKWHWQLPFYITVAVVGLGISNLFVYIGSIIWHWDINIVKIISIGAIFLWNFLAPKFLIFRK